MNLSENALACMFAHQCAVGGVAPDPANRPGATPTGGDVILRSPHAKHMNGALGDGYNPIHVGSGSETWRLSLNKVIVPNLPNISYLTQTRAAIGSRLCVPTTS